jgi:hypothetical protein
MRSSRRVLGLAQVFIAFGSLGFAACGTSPPHDGSSGGAPTVGGNAAGGSESPNGGSSVGGASGGSSSGGESASGGTGPETGGESGTGGSVDMSCNTGMLTTRLPCKLSETGLFVDEAETLGEGIHPYEPQFALWSDGADKRRWVWLPPDTQIDTTDMNYWSFPVGTKFWKEFSKDGKRIETRLIQKQKSGTWYTVAYLWQDDQKEAHAVPDGQMNASGTEHDVPNADQCWTCHSQQPDKALGFSAIQLSHAAVDAQNELEWTLDKLVTANLLTAPPAAAIEFSSGWSDLDRDMLGYMHGNCGTCHNPQGTANSTTGLDMWLKVEDLAKPATESSVYLGLVDVNITKMDGNPPDALKRIAPGSLDDSAAYVRFVEKDQGWKMPPLASEVVDPHGKELFEEFIANVGSE